ncbi:hypothetical protein CFOL_v3_16526 [Cephalotus follicularis]|uniref:N-lysine methyltransferase n=1 Tax=Cephalotus follicularis TaxID=3775 RepID=A0A1Q3BYT4_CEPFO|nr:hypothetical protein CFOL_v3_16526 [Cephalotus follicularis]
MASSSRRLRAFKRWMKSHGVECSDSLELADDLPGGQGIAVKALCDLKEGDVVARIPKAACLTIKTSGAHQMIESAGFDGYLGLSVALMYEKSLGPQSLWDGYLQLLPRQECLPLLWTLAELDTLLLGTEIHKIVKQDKDLIYEDWEESILPLVDSLPSQLNPNFFGVEQYLSAKSLIASRSFEIDDYHGFGMVPLADLFNHKNGAEDVHFTSTSYHCEFDADSNNYNNVNDEPSTSNGQLMKKRMEEGSIDVCATIGDDEESAENSFLDNIESPIDPDGRSSSSGDDSKSSPDIEDDQTVLEMIMVKNVKAGAEVFNAYGLLGNAALLHRYGFTEPNNLYDIVNIDLELVLEWSSSLFSGRYSRTRLSFWRRLGYSGCVSQDSEYFEISYEGEPQIELLILLYIMLLAEDTYYKLDLTVSTTQNYNGAIGMLLSEKSNIASKKASEMSKELLLTVSVCNALVCLADMRESFYGSNSLEDDLEALRSCVRDRKLYHSLVLRVSERRILEKMRTYAAVGMRPYTPDTVSREEEIETE